MGFIYLFIYFGGGIFFYDLPILRNFWKPTLSTLLIQHSLQVASKSRLLILHKSSIISAGIYLLKVSNRNPRTRCEMIKVNNKDNIRTTSMMSFWYRYC